MTVTMMVAPHGCGARSVPLTVTVDRLDPAVRRGTILLIDGELYTVTKVPTMKKKTKKGGKLR